VLKNSYIAEKRFGKMLQEMDNLINQNNQEQVPPKVENRKFFCSFTFGDTKFIIVPKAYKRFSNVTNIILQIK
jgi:hypothetical protein